MRKHRIIAIIFCFFLLCTFQGLAKTSSYTDPTLGFSLELPENWQKQKPEDSVRPYFVTFYGPKDSTGFVPTFVVAVVDKQKDFQAFVDAEIKLTEKTQKGYKLIKKECKTQKRCEVVGNYPYDPKIFIPSKKDQQKIIGEYTIKNRHVFIQGENKFYVLSAGCFTIKCNEYEKTISAMMNSFKEAGLLDKYFQ